jgi:hypothetical protein
MLFSLLDDFLRFACDDFRRLSGACTRFSSLNRLDIVYVWYGVIDLEEIEVSRVVSEYPLLFYSIYPRLLLTTRLSTINYT